MSTENIRPNQLRQDALNGRLTFDQARNRILGRQADGLARLLLLADGVDFYLKISDDGIDVLTGTDDQMIFNSNNNLFKIVDKGIATVSLGFNANGTQVSGSDNVAHSLGYEPLVLAWSITTSGGKILRNFPSSIVNAKSVNTTAVTIGYLRDEDMLVTNTDITFSITVSNSTGVAEPATDVDIMYFLLTETIA